MSMKRRNNVCQQLRNNFRCLWRSKFLACAFFGLVGVQYVLTLPVFRRPNVDPQLRLDLRSEGDPCQKFQNIHVVFSTDCSRYQQWQSYVFFYHAMRVGQPGNITRIVSGCTEQEQRIYAQRHDEEIVQKMSNRFHIHFTPDFSKQAVIQGKPYKFFNKPFGLQHWMQHALGYPEDQRNVHDDTIIALLDPDMVLTKPLVNNFDGFPRQFWYQGDEPGVAKSCASHGKPIAQQYGYGNGWIASVGDHLAEVVGKDSPIHNFTQSDGPYTYTAGPPYLLTARDMYKVVALWSDLTPKIHSHYPFLMAEMFGYAMAVAHLQLRHQLSFRTMISLPLVDFEGWQFLEGFAPNQICGREHVTNLPAIIHYCQHYSVGIYVVLKYYIQENFLSCGAPLLRNPPKDLAERYSVRRLLNGTMVPFDDPKQVIRFTFMLCLVTEVLNEAATYFKHQHCDEGANFNATYTAFPVE